MIQFPVHLPSLQAVWIHDSQTSTAIEAARRASIKNRRVDHQFHYASARQAELWLALHRGYSPAAVRPEIEEIYQSQARAIAQHFGGQGVSSVHVIGLGCGGGVKDGWILQALRTVGIKVRFSPLDVSPHLSLLSARHTENMVDYPIYPFVADIPHFHQLPACLDQLDLGEEPRLYTCFGLTPNFEPSELFAPLRLWLRSIDRVTISANLVKGPDFSIGMANVRPQYDNEETKTWLTRVLLDWGLEHETSDYTLETVIEQPGCGRFVASMAWPPNRLRLFFSARYTPQSFSELFKEQGLVSEAGFERIEPAGEEGVWFCRLKTLTAN